MIERSAKKILFYNDSPILGGHEFMTAQIANELSRTRKYEIFFLYSHQDIKKLLHEKVRMSLLPFFTKIPFPFIRNFNVSHLIYIKRIIKKINPHLIIVSQGDIEFGLKGLLAGRLSKIRTVSYIPIAFSFKEKRKHLALFRDLLNKINYKIPTEFITISNYQVSMLSRFVNKDKIHVIRNLIDDRSDFDICDLGTPNFHKKHLNIGIIGRIDFNQKNQNILINVAKLLEKEKMLFKMHIIGDGPDRKKLDKLINVNKMKKYFYLHNWIPKSNLNKFIKKHIDVVLIPSNFEGTPLVMLEALLLNKPLLISKIDSSKEYSFPEEFMIDQSSAKDIAVKILNLLNNFNVQEYVRLRNTIISAHSYDNFSSNIANTFHSLLEH